MYFVQYYENAGFSHGPSLNALSTDNSNSPRGGSDWLVENPAGEGPGNLTRTRTQSETPVHDPNKIIHKINSVIYWSSNSICWSTIS